MPSLQHSSGDLIADRRAGYAHALAETGDLAAAADLMRQALELSPHWPAGWQLLGDYAERAGDIEGAVAAWRRLLELDRDGVLGAALKLAAHGAGIAVAATDTAYVGALFDDYASRFDAALLQRLHYEVPRELTERVAAILGTRSGMATHAIDLGCGTGLMGERLRRHVSFLQGVDLSGGMIEETRRKGIYDRLERAELTSFLAAHAGGVDLVTASDVFNYCGELAPILAVAARVLNAGGLLAFSLEAHGGPEPMRLRPTLRFAHEANAAKAALAAAGFDILRFDEAVLRFDGGAPVTGYLVVAAKRQLALAVTAEPSETGAEAAGPVPPWML